MDWLAGLGQGFSNIAPAIQLMMMLQEAKAERDARASERTQGLTFQAQEGERNRAQAQQLADQQSRLDREKLYTEPLARQGMFISPSSYGAASSITPPDMGASADINPAMGAMKSGMQLAQGAGDAEGRLQSLRQKAAMALQQANLAGPGHVQSFEGGMAIGQAPFPTRSQSTSTSFTGVVPEQLQLRELDIKIDAMMSAVRNAIAQYRAVNPYGGNPQEEARITQEAIETFNKIWPTIRAEIMGGNAPLNPSEVTVSAGASATGGAGLPQLPGLRGIIPPAPKPSPVAPPVQPPSPIVNPQQVDPRARYRRNIRGF